MTIINITGLPRLSEPKQQEVGQSILVALYHANVEIGDAAVEFEEEF